MSTRIAALAAASLAAHALATPPQNVVLIAMDDVGVDLLGCYDAHFQGLGVPPSSPAATPAIDQLLAAQGVMFTNVWTSPVCTPSRAQILTGRFAMRNGQGALQKYAGAAGVRNPGLALDATLLPEVLRLAPAPYASAAVGKWHLADRGQAATLTHPLGEPPGRWFDRYAGSMFNLRFPAGVTSGNRYESWRKVYATALEPGVDPCGGSIPCEVAMLAPPVDNYATVDTADDALSLIASLPEPWFLYVAFNAPHMPLHDPPAGTPSAACGAYAPIPQCSAPASDKPAQTRCMLRELDAQIARVVCATDPGDTTVVLIGDNGTRNNAVLPPYDSTHAKGTMYQGGIQVPLIVRSPLIAPALRGGANDALVCSTDVFATVAEIAQSDRAAWPAGAGEDSVSLVPYLTGAASSSIRRTAYAEQFFPSFQPDPATGLPPPTWVGQSHLQAIRDGRFKLIRRTERDRYDPATITVEEELFDLVRDPATDSRPAAPGPTPDWAEANDLLQLATLPPAAASALHRLRRTLDLQFPTLVN